MSRSPARVARPRGVDLTVHPSVPTVGLLSPSHEERTTMKPLIVGRPRPAIRLATVGPHARPAIS